VPGASDFALEDAGSRAGLDLQANERPAVVTESDAVDDVVPAVGPGCCEGPLATRPGTDVVNGRMLERTVVETVCCGQAREVCAGDLGGEYRAARLAAVVVPAADVLVQITRHDEGRPRVAISKRGPFITLYGDDSVELIPTPRRLRRVWAVSPHHSKIVP
jgi:hypothetical protein